MALSVSKSLATCMGKKHYFTKAEAMMMAKRYEKKCGTERNRPYHCPICGMWHLTSRRNKWKTRRLQSE